MADVLQLVYDFSLMSFLCAGNLETECGAKRFLAVQATELANGGFFLSCNMSHIFGDGTWERLLAFFSIPSLKFVVVATLLRIHRCSNAAIQVRSRSGSQTNSLPINHPRKMIDRVSPLSKKKIFVFPKEKIALLKQKAIFVLKLISRYRQIQDDEIVILYMPLPTDVRTRAGPLLTKYYLGNAIQRAETTLKGKDLRGDDAFGRAASKMHDLVASQSKTTVKNFLTSYIEKPFIFGKSNGGNTKVVTISNSPRFDVYGNDFGWGRPVAIRRCFESEMEGMIQLFEGPENGSVHMELCLLPETLELLEKDSDFLNFVRS